MNAYSHEKLPKEDFLQASASLHVSGSRETERLKKKFFIMVFIETDSDKR